LDQILVLDATGRTVVSVVVGGSSALTLNIEDLAAAGYFLQVWDIQGAMYHFKLIKQ